MKFLPGIKHPKAVYPKVEKTVVRFVIKHPEWGCRRISRELSARGKSLSYVQVNKLLNRLGAENYGRRINFIRNYSGPGRLTADIRNEIVNKSLDGEKISKLAGEYHVSRDTIYRWINKYNQGGGLKDGYLTSVDHPRAIYPKITQNVLDLVVANPEYSVHTLAKFIPASSWTIWSILNRNGLNTYNLRFVYAQNRQPVSEEKTPAIGIFGRIRSVFESFTPNLAPAPPPKFTSILKTFGISSLFTFIIIYGSILWINVISGGGSFASGVGLIFATIALAAGMFFFLYSLKYYLTTAILLSFSNRQKKDRVDLENPGMNADLSTIQIKKYPFVSVHIPFYNERNVVERSIKAATNFDYPEYEVILCDDSTDETTDKIRAYQKSCLFKGEELKITRGEGWVLTEVEVRPGVTLKHLHRTTRTGYKGGALALALKLVDPRTEFVSIFDADFVPYPDSLNYFVKYFKIANSMNEDYEKSNIAAVQGYQWHVLNKSENWITRGVRSEYAGSYVVERSGAEIYKGLKQISGSVYMIRKDVLSQVGWGTSITEDFELTLKLYNAGYKVVYTPYVQAPAECVSTLKRMIRQRMRWAEGHSFNIKKMFGKLMLSPKLTPAEKFETVYLAPYYLQALFFLVGTFCWFLSEAVFRVRLPFWTELWGWSLILTNMVSLPLLNSVGMFLEESSVKDYSGLGSFVALSYIIVPFQAYAAVKGFLEQEEGPWFRTPKTGRVTDTFKRSGFYRFISGILPARNAFSIAGGQSPYLSLASANNRFENFDITKAKGRRWVGKLALVTLLIISNTLLYFSGYIQTFAPQPVHAEQNSGFITSPTANSGSAATAPATTENNFQNGVLAVNTDREVYLPGEMATIQMAALDPKGDSICNAGLSVEVNGAKQTGVIKTGACVGNSVTNTADYVLYYKTGTNGTYNIKVINTTTGLSSENSFTVDSGRTLDIVRKTATRLNPFKADSYPVNLYVASTNDYQGEVTDQVPANFKVINAGNAKVENGKITWQVNLKKGTTRIYQYTYQAPKISPELFSIGPVVTSGNAGANPPAASKWQLAVDGLTQTWTGNNNGNWMNAGNWASGTVPNPGDDLVFPASVATYSLTNDFPQYTMFESITISGSGYTLAGNDIILGQGLAGITDSVSSGGNTISLNFRMDVTRWITVTSNSETLTISGMITGLGGFNKKGQGKLILSGANTFAGTLKIDEGIVSARNDRALGTIAAGTEVVGGAALELQGGVNIDREPLTLRGYGVSENGALRNISDINTFKGLITLVGVAKIQSDADTLNLRGGITGTIPLIFDGAGNISFYDASISTSTGAVTKNGSGTVTYFYPNNYTGVTTINTGKILYGVDNAFASGNITINGGTLDISTYSDLVGTVTLGTLTGAAGTITGTTGMLSSGTWAVYSGTISAVIAGDVPGATTQLTKSTPATVTLTRPNQFTGAVAVNAGVLKIQDSMALGTIDGATTVASGATLQIDGNGSNLSIPEYITLNGSGVLFASALRNSTGNNTITGLITLGSISYIEADLGTTLTVDTKGLSALTYALHIGGAGNVTFTSTAPIYGTSAALTKNDTGTLTLGAFNNYTGVTTINNGTVVLSGLGAIPLSTATINSQATLTIDNSDSTTNINRLGDSLALTMNGGNFNIVGSSNIGIYETLGVLTTGTGNNTITVTPGSGGSTILRFASLTRTAGASILFRGTNFGAPPNNNVSTLLFTTAPNLVGDDGVAGTPKVSILQGAYGDNSLVGTGTDMVTYGLGNVNGLRLLNGAGFSNEYTTDFTVTNANIRISASTNAITSQINSLVLDSGSSIADAGTSQTITFMSGNILNLQSGATISGANTTIASSVEYTIRTVSDLTIPAAITTTLGLTKSGSGTLTFSAAAKTYTGLTSINEGTLLCGVTNAIPSVNVTVNNATLNIADRADTVSAVVLQSGTITGTSGVLTAASYDLRSGTVSAILAGSGTLTKSATNTQADATVTLTRENTYTGLTAINAGILKLGADDDGTKSPLGTTDNGTTIATFGALDLNGHNILIAEAITQFNGLGYGVAASVANGNSNMGAIMNSSASGASYSGAITLFSASRINADFGPITVGTGAISGAFALTLGGYGNMTVTSPIGSVTGLTKDGLGTVTLSGNSTCAGAFTISSGILKLGATGDATNGPLGTAVGATTISSGAILDLNGQTYATAEPLTINGTGAGTGDFSGGVLINTSASAATFPGNITLGAASTIKADYGNMILSGTGGGGTNLALTLAGSNTASSLAGTVPSGTGTITKLGSGTWNISGDSTFTGVTTIYEGTLQLGAVGDLTNGPLGTAGAGTTTVLSGGVLDLNGLTLSTAEALTINGFGINAGGALYNNNANPTGYSGTITHGTDARVANVGAGLLTLSGAITTVAALTLYFGGAGNTTISTTLSATTCGLLKDGNGTVTLNGIASYTGTTTINAGTFAYGASGKLAATGVFVNAGIWDMGGVTNTVAAVTLVGGTIQNGTLTGTAYTFENGTISAVLAGAIAVAKNTSGTVTLTGVNTNTGVMTINQGTLVVSGNGKSATTGVTINVGGTFNLDNSTTSVTTRLNNATPPAITMNGGNFNYLGCNNTSTTAAETDGALNITTGYNIVTVTPGTGGSTTMTFASLSRTAGAEVLFRGTTLGTTPAAGVSTLVFTASPGLTGGGGNSGTNTVSIIKGAFGDGSLTGTGTDMVTYKPPTDTSTSLRLLTSGEYASTLTANANVKLTGPTAAAATNTNSLILNGNDITNASVTLPIAGASLAGNVLMGTANSIAGANTTLGIPATYELCILANATATISATIGTAVSGLLTLGGTGNLNLNAANLYTGTTYIDNATLTYLTNNAISSGGVTIVGGTYNLNGSSDTVGALSINAGTVQTGSGTLTSTSVTTVANNYISTTISGNLALGSGQTFTVGDGLVDNDLIISAVVSGGTLTKAGAGILVLSGNNTYTGATAISNSGGTIRLGATGGATYSPLGTTDAGTTVGTTDTLDLNGYTLGTAEALTISGTGATSNGAIANTSSTIATYSGQLTLGATVSIYANFGDINLTSTGTVTGANALTLTGGGNGTFAGTLANVASSITKSGNGTWTVSGNSAYTSTTTISAGVFRLGSAGSGGNGPLGTTGGATTVSGTGILDLNGYTLATAEPISISGTGIANCGAIYSNSASPTNVTYSGTITLAATPRIVNLGTGTLTFSGNISGANALTTVNAPGSITLGPGVWSGTGTLTKEGWGTTILSGQNSMTGSMLVTTGYLQVGVSGDGTYTALGTSAGGVTVTAGAVLDLSTYYLNGASTYEPLTLNGSGIKNGGAVISSSSLGNNFGALTLSTACRIINSGTGIINVTGLVATASNLIIGGTGPTTISGSFNTAGITVTKFDSGTLIFSGASNINTGLVRINGGILQYGTSNAINTGPVTIAGGTLDVNGQTDTVGIVTLISGTLTDTNVSPGVLTIATNSIFESGTVSEALAGATALAIAKNTGGTVTFSNNGTVINTYTGTTSINAGTLQYLASNIMADASLINVTGGILDIGANSDTIATLTLTSGSVTGTSGVLTGTATPAYAVQSGTITAILGGGVNLTKTTSGTVTLTGVNTYTGITTITLGMLSVGTIGNGSAGGSNLGNASNLAANLVFTAGTLQYTGGPSSTDRSSTLTAITVDVTNPSTILTMAGATNVAAGALTKAGSGTLNLAAAQGHTGLTTVLAGTLQYGVDNALSTGAVTVTNGIYDINNHSDSVGAVTLQNDGQIIDSFGTNGVLTSTTTFALLSGTVSARLAESTVNSAISKTSSGRVILSGSNSFTATTPTITVTTGVLNVQNSLAFGGAAPTVANLAALEIQSVSGITIPNTKTITITGGGINNQGAINNISGSNVIQATVALGATNTRINSTGGSLLLSAASSITGPTFNLIVGGLGPGNVTISGVIGTTSGALTKDGAGTLTLSGANTYTGVTTVSSGTVIVGINAPSGGNGAFGNASSEVVLGTAGGNSNASILTGGAFTVGRIIRVASTDVTDTGTRTITIGGNTANNSTFSGAIYLGSTNFAGESVALNAVGGGQVTFSGVIQDPSGMDPTTYSVTTSGNGTVVYGVANTYTGSTNVSFGTLKMGIANGFLSGTVAISSGGTLDLATYSLSSAGGTSFTNSGTIRLAGNETITNTPINNSGSLVQYYGSSGPYSVKSWTYYDIQFSSPVPTTYTPPSSFTATHNMTIDSGNTFNAAGATTVNIDGKITNNGTLTAPSSTGASAFTLGGDFENNGTFNSSNGRLTLDGNGGAGNQTLSGTTTTTTFYQLYITANAARTVYFKDGNTYSIADNGTVSFQGSASGQLTLTRLGSSNHWYLNVSNTGTTINVNYVTASWSNASARTMDVSSGTGNIDGNDNINWVFIVAFSSTSSSATGYSFQRKTWYDGARFWSAYYNGSNIVFYYSSDNGTSWTQDTNATIFVSTNDFSIEADSSNCFIVYTSGYNINGRQASNYPGTGFSWGAESTVLTGSGTIDQYDYPVIERDSGSYVWVGASYTGSSVYYFKTIKETVTTNTLPADSGGDTVYSISDPTNSNSNVFGVIVPQTSQNMYAAFTEGTSLEGCVWVNGSTAWQDSSGNSCASGANYDSIATVTSGVSNNISAVADSSGNVHLAYIDSNDYTTYQEYTSSAWQTAVTLDGNSGNGYVSMSLNTSDNSLYAIWIRGNHIYYEHGVAPFASGNWDVSATDWHSGTNLTNLTSDSSGSGIIFAEWTSGSSSPYTVNWDDVIVPENIYLMIGFVPLVSYFIKRKKKSSAEVRRKS